MATIRALPHVYTSVQRGYRPEIGYGFQTLAVAEELAGTDDLRVLEDASFYAVPRGYDDGPENYPVKESFFRLPSGHYAVGRIVHAGVDALGRDGNYLAHHLVVTADDLRAIGADPFLLLDHLARSAPPADLMPGFLPPVMLDLALSRAQATPDARVNADLLANLAVGLLQRRAQTMLLVGDDPECRALLRALVAVSTIQERLRLTFSTHFRDADFLRPHFAVVAVRSRQEMPARLKEYTTFDLAAPGKPRVLPGPHYEEWLLDAIRNQRWPEVRAVTDALDALRADDGGAAVHLLPIGTMGCEVLWEQVPDVVALRLPGDAKRVADFLHRIAMPRALADALLARASPSFLCGESASPVDVEVCLAQVRAAATPREWKRWLRRWSDDPQLAILARGEPWWRRLLRRAGQAD